MEEVGSLRGMKCAKTTLMASALQQELPQHCQVGEEGAYL